MKKKQLPWTVVGLMAISGACLAGEIRIRAVSITPGYPEGKVFVQDSEGKEDRVKVEVKSFLNHEFGTLNFESKSLVFTSDPKPGNGVDAAEGPELGRVEIPSGLKSGILVFRQGLKDEKAEVVLLNDAVTQFPAGSTKVVNSSPDPMRIELEGENFDCGGESELLIENQPVRSNNSSGMRAFLKKDGEWVQVKVGVWPHPGKKRVLKVIILNPLTKQIEIHGLRDISDPS